MLCCFRDQTLSNIFYLQSSVKDSAAQHVQTILKANMKVLEEVGSPGQGTMNNGRGLEKEGRAPGPVKKA